MSEETGIEKVTLPTKASYNNRKKRRPTSLEEIESIYSAQDGETSQDKRRRLANKRMAVHRWVSRQHEGKEIGEGTTAARALGDDEEKTEEDDSEEFLQRMQARERQAQQRQQNICRRREARANQTTEDRLHENERQRANRAERGIAVRLQQQSRRASAAASSNPPAVCSLTYFDESAIPLQTVGACSIVCRYCDAIKWKGESPNACCLKGKIYLAPFDDPPGEIQSLFLQPPFLEKVRSYNSVFAFTSMGANIDQTLANARDGVYTFRIHGTISHRIGSLLPVGNASPAFAQIYVFDGDMENQVNARCSIMSGLDREVVSTIQRVLVEHNPFVQQFMTAAEFARDERVENVRLAIREAPGTDLRRNNRPTTSEVAAIILDDNDTAERDIILHPRGQPLKKISDMHPAFDPLHFPLLFVYGEHGWSTAVRYVGEGARYNNTKVSIKEFVGYRLHVKKSGFNLIHRASRLFQQWCVEEYVKTELHALRYIRTHQSALRAELYRGVQDMVSNNDHSLQRVGTHIVLPATFTGGERYMRKQYYDSMAIVRTFGKPDLFVTVTCNPEWQEIKEALLPCQQAQDRPDIVARVFKLKLKAIIEDIVKKKIFGKVVAYVYVVEFQKRGLPHAHMLIKLDESSRPKTPEDYDNFVTAEIPDPHLSPRLFQVVTSCMMHGPCGSLNRSAPCMRDGACSKDFPKSFSEETRHDGKGYPVYKRRNNRRTTLRRGVELDNRWVVPYNPYLSAKFNCHVNVEICSTIDSVKYLYKYVYKGHDRATVTVGESEAVVQVNIDEVQQFQDGRYVSAPEACWRIFKFKLQEKSHTVIQLPVHTEENNFVTFRPSDNAADILNNSRHTMLTRFFEVCSDDPAAADLLYHEFPQHFTWQQGKKWKARQQRGEKAIGRMVWCSPMDSERYFLRMLLCYRRGPKSYQDLRTIDGVHYATFKDAARAAGYLEDDSEWHSCMQEAATSGMPSQLRLLFALILVYCEPADTARLWRESVHAMSEDFQRNANCGASQPIVTFQVIKSVDLHLQSNSKRLTDYPDLPQLSAYSHLEGAPTSVNRLINNETSYDNEELNRVAAGIQDFNEYQLKVFEIVMAAVCNGDILERLFFLDGPGGTGKSFLLSKILAAVRLKKKIALAVASSGIAALLLQGGRTAHSRFKLGTELTSTSTCRIPQQSHLAQLIRQCDLIVWDEAPMTHRFAFEALDRTLKSLMENESPFGGKVVLLAGDFRQILPVVPRATAGEIVSACVKKSRLWAHFKTLRINTNMRVQNAPTVRDATEIQEFAEFLLHIGEARHKQCTTQGESHAQIPRSMVVEAQEGQNSVSALIEHIYGDIHERYMEPSYFSSRAILTPINVDVQTINQSVLETLPGDLVEYTSIDSIEDRDEVQRNLYPVEFLNTIIVSGMPPHKLQLKIGTPIMLLRNINGEQGLCNGTRLQVRQLLRNCIIAEILTGAFFGKRVAIPRIPLTTNEMVLPFQLRRRQFPVQVSFAMTVNKAQGQSVHHLGVYLPQPVFSHGQLYVALSRVTSRVNIKILIDYDVHEEDDHVCVQNVVYQNVL